LHVNLHFQKFLTLSPMQKDLSKVGSYVAEKLNNVDLHHLTLHF
jgi:hypothetical protein